LTHCEHSFGKYKCCSLWGQHESLEVNTGVKTTGSWRQQLRLSMISV